ncbi:MAG: hypothetical protein QXI19_04315 [Candidatus Caldarchaeum sp.]
MKRRLARGRRCEAMPKEYGIHYRPDLERGSMSSPAALQARAESTKSKPQAQGAKSK